MKSYIIGISGCKNSGKDTVASMINYIFATGITNAKFQDWILKRESYDNTNTDRIIHFADGLKDVLSIMFSIDRKFFDIREYKDDHWFCITTNNFITHEQAISNPDIKCVTNELLTIYSLADIIKIYNKSIICIKLRTLLQYFGFDIARRYLYDNIWVNSTINKAIDKALSRRLCIIADVRFANEADSIKTNYPSLYGGLIKINRETNIKDNHKSEQIDFDCDFIINNNGKLSNLFYKVLDICQKIITK